ncbi:UNVERIFIED_CONTAM: hypothetical protein FKN15_069774 [Acipenser sinensis]
METPEKRDSSAMDPKTPSPTMKAKSKKARKQLLTFEGAARNATEPSREDPRGQTLPWLTKSQLHSLRDFIVECIRECLKSKITAEIKTVCTEIKSIQSRLQQTEEKISVTFSTVDKQNKHADIHQAAQRQNRVSIKESEMEIALLKSRLAELVDRNRQLNLRIVGLPEGTEGGDPIDFLQKSLPMWLPSLTRPIEIERAHHIYDGSSARRDRPRTFIFKLLRYTTPARRKLSTFLP